VAPGLNFAAPFIARPVGTTLLAVGLLLVGIVAYGWLPVASLPSVDLPAVFVAASRPGADPATMAASVAAPLERRLAAIAGVTELTSISGLGTTSIVVLFDLGRTVEGAAQDVQSAVNAAMNDLPDLPQVPQLRKLNPSASPILILALTSDTRTPNALYDVADTVIRQRISQIDGVAQVTVMGADQPAIRVEADPAALAAMGLGLEAVRSAIAAANALGPTGSFDGTGHGATLATNGQLHAVADYGRIVVRSGNGTVVRLSDVAAVREGALNNLSAAWVERRPTILISVSKQVDANAIETVDRIQGLLGELRGWIPADVEISVVADRTTTIRASVRDMQITLAAVTALVMLVVFVFLRRGVPTLAAGVTIPLSLAGTCAAMWACGFSINNLSLMALAVAVGFVVDDAIVMIENAFRNLEAGLSPLRAALAGARQIGFTVVAISLSLAAAFIPLLFMGGIVGRFLREFSLTLVFMIAISTAVSLSVTPMICAHLMRGPPPGRARRVDRLLEAGLDRVIALYARSLRLALAHRGLMLLVMAATVALTVALFITTPKGFIPQGDSTLVVGTTEASTDISFKAMVELQKRAEEIVSADPAVVKVASAVGSSGFNSVNQGRLFVSLKPLEARRESAADVIDRLRGKLRSVAGLRVFLVAQTDVPGGARQSKAQFQFTLWSADIEALQHWVPRVVERLRGLPGLTDVSTDREQGGLQASLVIDRLKAAQLGVRIADIDNALNDAFAQRQVSTVYTERNQYRVVLAVDPGRARDPEDLAQIHVSAGQGGATAAAAQAAGEVPLTAFARVERTVAPLVVNHQGQFPAVTITYNLTAETGLQQAADAIRQAVAEMHLPDAIHAEEAGTARNFVQSSSSQPVLLLAALVAVYIVLGVLYESLAHPLTIVSTLPSAGLGALFALQLTGSELDVIAFIGIILLIGIVKKNGIMLVDFALEGERHHRLPAAEAIYQACIERFRPILMTTLAALLGAVPLAMASGPGAELRRPLGITIIGGLIVSQMLTLYTTPVIYLMLDRLHRRWWGNASL
jgi:hydrophobe/amphiphile efflux-1 (HAE1) family protein